MYADIWLEIQHLCSLIYVMVGLIFLQKYIEQISTRTEISTSGHRGQQRWGRHVQHPPDAEAKYDSR